MKTKNGHYLMIMLAVLMIHTIALSTWLTSNDQAQKKQAILKYEQQNDKVLYPKVVKTKYVDFKDSTKVVHPFLLNNLTVKVK